MEKERRSLQAEIEKGERRRLSVLHNMIQHNFSKETIISLGYTEEEFLKADGRAQERLSAILNLIQHNFTEETIFSLGYTEDEFSKAVENFKSLEISPTDAPHYIETATKENIKRKGAAEHDKIVAAYIERGKAEGIEQGKLLVLHNMMQHNFNEDVIFSLGYTEEQISKSKTMPADDPSFTKMTKEDDKKTGGVTMRDIFDRFTEQGRAEGVQLGRLSILLNMIQRDFAKEEIFSAGYTDEELSKAAEGFETLKEALSQMGL